MRRLYLCWLLLPLLALAAPTQPPHYDQRQHGSHNIQVSVDGLSLVWSPNSLLAAAALLEPALYGHYPQPPKENSTVTRQ